MSSAVNSLVITLRERRKALGLSQRELDKAIGLSECMIAKWESNVRSPTASSLDRWASALGFRLELTPSGSRKKKR